MAQVIKHPFGAADSVALTATGAQAITITNQLTFIDGVTTQATAERTLNLTIDSNVYAGAMIHCRLKTNGTENTVFGTGMSGATLAGGAGKTKNVLFIYNGTSFLEAGTPVQID